MTELIKTHPIDWTERLKNWREALLTMNLPDERMEVHPDGEAHRLAEGFLRTCNGGTARAYGYLLVDHLRWLEFESLSPG